MSLQLVAPRIQPPLDENFRPAVLVNQNFRRESALLGIRLILGLERSGARSRVLKQEYIRPSVKFRG